MQGTRKGAGKNGRRNAAGTGQGKNDECKHTHSTNNARPGDDTNSAAGLPFVGRIRIYCISAGFIGLKVGCGLPAAPMVDSSSLSRQTACTVPLLCHLARQAAGISSGAAGAGCQCQRRFKLRGGGGPWNQTRGSRRQSRCEVSKHTGRHGQQLQGHGAAAAE